MFWTNRAGPSVSGEFVDALLKNISARTPLAFKLEKRQSNWWGVVRGEK